MRRQYWIHLFALLVLVLVSACNPAAPTQSGTAGQPPAAQKTACEVQNFEATVLEGKNKGLAMEGHLTLQADAGGNLQIQLKTNDGKTVKGGGQVLGHAINLYFDLGNDQYIFGTGTLENSFADCKGTLGGTFAGPDRSDSGGWGCSCCPCYIRTISPPLGYRVVPADAVYGQGTWAQSEMKGNMSPTVTSDTRLIPPDFQSRILSSRERPGKSLLPTAGIRLWFVQPP